MSVPDVGIDGLGLEGGPVRRGLPDASSLPLAARAVLELTAVADHAARIGGGALVTATVAPLLLRPRVLRRDLETMDFYAAAAASGDSTIMFPAPAGVPVVRARRSARLPIAPRVGRVELLSFDSPFRAVHPAMREPYARHTRNQVAWAQHWRHGDGPRPTIIVIHGFMASPYWLNGAFFAMPWFYGHGYDVVFVTLPFHGRRRGRRSPYNGAGLFGHGIAHIAEAMAHAIHDIRTFVSYLLAQGAPRVGVTGISLGGYTTALLAATDERLHVAIPNAAVSDMATMAKLWAPTGQLIETVLPRRDLDFDAFRAVTAAHSPLSYPARLAKDRLFIIAGLGDRLAPPAQSEELWEHWGRPQLHWYPGSHALHVSQGTYLKLMGRFLQQTGFSG